MNRDEAQLIILKCESASGPDMQAKYIRCPELREEHEKLHEKRRRLYAQRPTPDPAALAKIHAELYERVYMTLEAEYITEASYLEALQVLKPRNQRNAGRPPTYNWPLVCELAVRAVKQIFYDDGNLPQPHELAAKVAEDYLEHTDNDLDETSKDVRKYCAAVVRGFKNE